MSSLLDLIFKGFDYLGRYASIFRAFIDSILATHFFQLSVLLTAFTGVFAGIRLALFKVTDALTAFSNSQAIEGQDLPVTAKLIELLELANVLLPITELFFCITIMASIYASAFIYRFVKSWIPTVS